MKTECISLEVGESHPAYQWAKRQSDSVGAFGHIGTHIDCYERSPDASRYEVDAVVIDCTQGMPEAGALAGLDLQGRALVLYTANVERNGYGAPAYGKMLTCLEERVLEQLLEMGPAFILVDSYGIGLHGEQHIAFDKKCEASGCFVIENVFLNREICAGLISLSISIDMASLSTGKRCEVIALYR
ncbi:cyclase family protein [Craterilacuibacter sp. RT1T]|uniref:cyclase family protein n=1 Tax=Craterilacuibacter sp. RT1T TaxID=2942211 RepID=UPI0020BEDFA5|nr:cyclase family protein [Craterilacuibacter sp. RT1T]MCL6262406.1 cyclase family protein [Craterilacuibacter sp. RT1T]